MSDNSIKKIKIGNSEYDLTASNGIYYIEGTGSTAGTWLGSHDDITSYYPGLMIAYKIGIAGASATTLNINNLGAVTVVKNATTAISTNFAVNSVIFLVYTVDGSTAYWKAHDYDANTKNTAGTSEKASTKLYITGATSQTSSGTTTYSNQKVYIGTDNSLYSNSSKVITQADTATTSAAGIMSAADKTKLDGIATGANAYTHPTTSGNKHIPSGGSSGQILRWSADGTATWGADNNTTYSAATQSAAGLMSAADKTKLDGIATGANNYTYTLPTASSSTLGGVKTGSNITNSSGTISLTKANVTAALGYTPPTTNTTYSNMTAATSSAAGKAGLVPAPAAGKQTSFLRGDGTWVVPTNTTYSAATQSANGLMSAADKTKLDGIATGANNYTLPTASSSILGGVKTGSNITNSSGTISLTKANVTSALGYTPPTTNTTYSNATQSAAGLMSAADKTKLDGIENKIVTFTITGNCVNHEQVTINTTYANIKSLIDSGKIVHLVGSENSLNSKIVFISQYYMESSEYGSCMIFASDIWYDSTIYLALYADNTAYISTTLMEEGGFNFNTTNFSEGMCWWEKKGHIVRYFANLKTKTDMYLWQDYAIAYNIPWATWWETHGEPNDSGCFWAENGTMYFHVWASVNAWAEDRWGNSYIPKESWITGQLTQFLYESDAV